MLHYRCEIAALLLLLILEVCYVIVNAWFSVIYGSKCLSPRPQPVDKHVYVAINRGKQCINSRCACAAFIATTAIVTYL